MYILLHNILYYIFNKLYILIQQTHQILHKQNITEEVLINEALWELQTREVPRENTRKNS